MSSKLVKIGSRASRLLGKGLAKKVSHKTSLVVNECPVITPTASKNE
jgi:hypothetical protein